MQRVVNKKTKIAFKLSEGCELRAQAGDRIILDLVEGEGDDAAYVAYNVPRERFKQDFTVVK